MLAWTRTRPPPSRAVARRSPYSNWLGRLSHVGRPGDRRGREYGRKPLSRSFTVDATPPNTTINSGPSGTTNDASPSFTFSSSEPNSSFECRLDSNQESDFQSCSSPKSYSSLADGDHTFDVRATDAVGNTDHTPASRSFTVDTTPPTATAPVRRLLLGQTTTPVKVGWSGGDNLTSQANLKFDLRKRSYQGGAWGPWSSALTNTSLRAITTRLGPGTPVQYEVRSRDQVGNVSAYKVARSFTPRGPRRRPRRTPGPGPRSPKAAPPEARSRPRARPVRPPRSPSRERAWAWSCPCARRSAQ